MVTCTQVAKGQYGLCLVFLTQDKIRKKSLSGNNGVTVSQTAEPWAGDIQDLQKRKEPVSRQLIILGHSFRATPSPDSPTDKPPSSSRSGTDTTFFSLFLHRDCHSSPTACQPTQPQNEHPGPKAEM